MFLINLRVGFFLAVRQIKKSSLWTNVLIVFIMTLTFLNLVFVTGILVGLIQGASDAYREEFSGDVYITTLPNKDHIPHTAELLSTIKNIEGVRAVSPRYVSGATVEANYQTQTNFQDAADQVVTTLVGINPYDEQAVTKLGDKVIEGEYLVPGDDEFILIGSDLLEQYSRGFDLAGILENVVVGSKVRATFNGIIQKEFIVKGIIQTKVDDVIFQMYVTDETLRKIIGRDDTNVGEIAIALTPETDANSVKKQLQRYGYDAEANIETSLESQGAFLDDIRDTFSTLGNVIGSIGLVVASITIFIIIFINAITRQKYIGILKGIGIDRNAIILSYMFQSFFYAMLGITLGTLLVYLVLKPYFDANPLDFPFSDGILVVEGLDVFMRASLLSLATLIAGFIPAWMITRRNTLNAILGRNE